MTGHRKRPSRIKVMLNGLSRVQSVFFREVEKIIDKVKGLGYRETKALIAVLFTIFMFYRMLVPGEPYWPVMLSVLVILMMITTQFVVGRLRPVHSASCTHLKITCVPSVEG